MADNRPRLVEASRRLEEPVATAEVAADMEAVDKKVVVERELQQLRGLQSKTSSFWPQVGINSDSLGDQVLPSFYAEDQTNAMNLERRREALAKFLAVIKSDIDRERKGKVRSPFCIIRFFFLCVHKDETAFECFFFSSSSASP